ncbi:hypothetical protein NEF87_002620 [Candidatus Lokiarchaeum ossiferum]|uniref:Uncharacterized protein n=1 Tax=Candidatus Lokiarchaeum ossiferum TaxID=2951803 RepID=A0ABY6HS47_9ARCH|nr:hypothetical protein NEF87_002620 [Candidatus Lokiarchaeum sp. B-35]
MADDFSFNCPRCGKEPKRGKFLGSEIWHDECLVEDMVEKFNSGTPREEIEKTLKRVKDKGVEQNVGLKCGWPEYQPPKSQEEIEAEYQAELEAAEAKADAEAAIKAAEEAESEEAKAAAEAAVAEAQSKADNASKVAENAKIIQTPSSQNSGAPASTSSMPSTPLTPMGAPQFAPYPPMTAPQMAPMPMMAPSRLEAFKPAPTDEVVRNIAISAMEVCLKTMKKDVEYGKLLFKFMKEFNWEAEEDDDVEKSEDSDKEDVDEEIEDAKPFLVED